MTRRAANAIAGIVMVLAVPAAQANLITNGSFEDAAPGFTAPSSGFTTHSAGSASAGAIAGWTVTAGTIDWVSSTLWAATDGVRTIDLNGNSQGELSAATSFATTAGLQYLLTFDMSGNPDNFDGEKTMDVSVGNQSGVQFSFDTTSTSRSNMGWVGESLLFTALGSTTALSFSSTTTNGCCWGPVIDNVSVTAVPAPAPLGLAGLGLLALGALRRR